jgi:sigma-B regulation protein RsbU (phosphoserine phosphatase)
VDRKLTVEIPEEDLRGMERKIDQLKTLMDLSSIISSTLDFDELVALVMEKAKAVMEAEACSILIYNRDTGRLEFEVALCKEDAAGETLKKQVTLEMGQGIAGWVALNLKPLVIDDVGADSRFFKGADALTGFATKSIIAVPLIGRSGLIGVAEMINPKKKDYDMEIFQLLCRQFAIAIENSLFHRESIQRERLRQELDIASELQKSFLPLSPVFKKGNLMAAAVNISAAKVGGDIYDFVEPSEGKAGVFIGDVSGKGVSAAIYMAKASSDFRYMARLSDSPSAVLGRLNGILASSPRGMFLTGIYIVVDTATGVFDFAAAGHPPFLWLSDDEVKVVSAPSGPPLGIISAEYPVSSFSMERGDRLLLFTDGVFDAKDREGRRIGFESIVKYVKVHRNEDRLYDRLVDFVDEYAQGVERADDLTVVEVGWGGV